MPVNPASFAESLLRPHAHETSKRMISLLKKEQALIPYHELRSFHKETKENAALSKGRQESSPIDHFQLQIVLRIYLLAHSGAADYEHFMTKVDAENPPKGRRRRKRSVPPTAATSTESFWVRNLTKLLSLAAITCLPPETDLGEFVRETLDMVPKAQSTKLAANWKDAILDFMEIQQQPSVQAKSPSPIKPIKTKKNTSTKSLPASQKPAKPQRTSLLTLSQHQKKLATSSLTSSRNHRMGSHFQKTLLHNMVVRHPPQKSKTIKPALKKPQPPSVLKTATPTKKPAKLLFVVQETPEDDDKRKSNNNKNTHQSPIRRKRSRVLWETPPELSHKSGPRPLHQS